MPGRKYPLVNKVSTCKGDYPITSFVTQQIFDSAVSYQPDPDDLFICSHPKNGTTWMLYILHMVRGGCLDFVNGDHLGKYYACLDFIGAEKTKEKFPSPRMVQTHLRFNQISVNDANKYIFVARNPKDSVVSFYYHTLGFDFYEFSGGKFDDFFDHWVSGNHDFGDYFDMVPYWWEESQKRKNIHFVLYEDLKSDFENEVLKIAAFLGQEYRSNLIANNKALLNAITKKAHISHMKKSVQKYMARDRPEHLPFTRKGVIGDWKQVLNEQQSKLIDEKLKQTAKQHAGFEKIWENYQEYL